MQMSTKPSITHKRHNQNSVHKIIYLNVDIHTWSYYHSHSFSELSKRIQDIPDCLAVQQCCTGIQWTVSINKKMLTISEADKLWALSEYMKIIMDERLWEQFLHEHFTYILNVVGVILRVPGNKIFQENCLKQQHPDWLPLMPILIFSTLS